MAHKFEAAGLGQAPYRYIGCEEITFQAYPGAPVQAGGSCDYCSTGIRNAFWFQSTDGKRFKVGCDCYYSASSNPQVKAIVVRDNAKLVKAAAAKRLVERTAAAHAKLAAEPALLTDRPHPYQWHADNGKTMRDYIEFLLGHGGAKGRLDACKALHV